MDCELKPPMNRVPKAMLSGALSSIGEEEASIAGQVPDLTDGPIFCVDPIGT